MDLELSPFLFPPSSPLPAKKGFRLVCIIIIDSYVINIKIAASLSLLVFVFLFH